MRRPRDLQRGVVAEPLEGRLHLVRAIAEGSDLVGDVSDDVERLHGPRRAAQERERQQRREQPGDGREEAGVCGHLAIIDQASDPRNGSAAGESLPAGRTA